MAWYVGCGSQQVDLHVHDFGSPAVYHLQVLGLEMMFGWLVG